MADIERSVGTGSSFKLRPSYLILDDASAFHKPCRGTTLVLPSMLRQTTVAGIAATGSVSLITLAACYHCSALAVATSSPVATVTVIIVVVVFA